MGQRAQGNPWGHPGSPTHPGWPGRCWSLLGCKVTVSFRRSRQTRLAGAFSSSSSPGGPGSGGARRTGWQRTLRDTLLGTGTSSQPPPRASAWRHRPAMLHPASANEPHPFLWVPTGRYPSSIPHPQGPPALTFLPLLRGPICVCRRHRGFAVPVLTLLLLPSWIFLLLKLLRVPLKIPEPRVILVPADTLLSHHSFAPIPSTAPQGPPRIWPPPCKWQDLHPDPQVPVLVQ